MEKKLKNFRFDKNDLKNLNTAKRKNGFRSETEVIRFALKKLAEGTA